MLDDVKALIRSYPIISDQVDVSELQVIVRELFHVIDESVSGDIVELGCYTGTTSLFLRRVLELRRSDKELHVYDSFEGLPAKLSQDHSPAGEQFIAGELLATKKVLLMNFKKANLQSPIVHKGWFEDLTPKDIPASICFAFLDGDYYSSVMSSLKLVWPLLRPGAVVVVDDYANEALPGAAKAVDEWLQNHPAQIHVEASLAVIKI